MGTNQSVLVQVVPDRSMSNCLDTELPGAGLDAKAGREEEEAQAGPGSPISWNPAEMEDTLTKTMRSKSGT
jgi:hypothetical protein